MPIDPRRVQIADLLAAHLHELLIDAPADAPNPFVTLTWEPLAALVRDEPDALADVVSVALAFAGYAAKLYEVAVERPDGCGIDALPAGADDLVDSFRRVARSERP